VVETGKATAEALRLVSAEWQAAGRDARDLYILQHLRDFVEAAVARVSAARVGELTVVDGGDGASFTGAVASFPAAAARVVEETGRALGIDLRELLEAPNARGAR
jgi:flotillin